MLRARVLGTFRLSAGEHSDLTPKGAKNQALLAMLLMSPEMTRPRRWLEEKLWSSFAPEQASANLRQALSKVRQALGEHADVLFSDRANVSLDVNRIEVDLLSGPPPTDERTEFLQGISVRDPAFQEWLSKERQALAMSLSRFAPTADAGVVIRCPPGTSASEQERVYGGILANQIGKTVAEQVRAWCQSADMASGPESDLTVEIHVLSGNSASRNIYAQVIYTPTGRNLFSNVITLPGGGFLTTPTPEIANLIFNVSDRILAQLPSLLPATRPEQRTAALARQALTQAFTFEPTQLQEAQGLVAQAKALDSHPIYGAWAVLLQILQLTEVVDGFYSKGVERLHEACMRIQASDMENPMVLGVLSLAQTLILGDIDRGSDLAEAGHRLNPYNPLVLAALAENKAASGEAAQLEQAQALIMNACNIAVSTPFHVWLEARRAELALAAGQFEQAASLAERVSRTVPHCTGNLRVLLFAYALMHDNDKAALVMRRMQKVAPKADLSTLLSDRHSATRIVNQMGGLEPALFEFEL
jgi:hypothetical protein